MRGFLRLAIRLAIIALIIYSARRYLERQRGTPADALARGEAAARRAVGGARDHLLRAIEEGREAAAEAKRDLESAAGDALEANEDTRRPDDPEI